MSTEDLSLKRSDAIDPRSNQTVDTDIPKSFGTVAIPVGSLLNYTHVHYAYVHVTPPRRENEPPSLPYPVRPPHNFLHVSVKDDAPKPEHNNGYLSISRSVLPVELQTLPCVYVVKTTVDIPPTESESESAQVCAFCSTPATPFGYRCDCNYCHYHNYVSDTDSGADSGAASVGVFDAAYVAASDADSEAMSEDDDNLTRDYFSPSAIEKSNRSEPAKCNAPTKEQSQNPREIGELKSVSRRLSFLD